MARNQPLDDYDSETNYDDIQNERQVESPPCPRGQFNPAEFDLAEQPHRVEVEGRRKEKGADYQCAPSPVDRTVTDCELRCGGTLDGWLKMLWVELLLAVPTDIKFCRHCFTALRANPCTMRLDTIACFAAVEHFECSLHVRFIYNDSSATYTCLDDRQRCAHFSVLNRCKDAFIAQSIDDDLCLGRVRKLSKNN